MTEFDIRELLSDYEENSIELREKEIVSADKIKEDVMNRIDKTVLRKARKWTGAMLAAVICVTVLGAAALAVSLLSLDERRGEPFTLEEPEPTDGYAVVTPEVEPSRDIVYTNVNVIGSTDSPEYKAAQEWTDWCLAHQEENTLFPKGIENYTMAELDEITEAIDNDVFVSMGANTDEAKETLLSIASKYGLRVPESFRSVYPKDLYDMTGQTDFLPLDGESRAGTWYEGGCLSVTNSAALQNGKTINYDLIRSVRGMFNKSVQLTLEQDVTEEWQYVTADGTTVTLDLGANRSVLMAELPNSFVYVNIRGGTENDDPTRDFTGPDTLTCADLEAFAELIDFETLDSIR